MDLGKAVLVLSADPSQLNATLEATKAKAEGWAGGVAGVAKGAALAIAGIGTAALGIVGGLSAMAVSVAHDAGEVNKLKRELGLTTEEASRLRYEGNRMGLDIDDLSKSFGIFSKNVDNGTKAIKDNNIQVVRNSAGNVDFEATLGKVADRFKAMPDGVEKSSLAMEIFGKGGKDLIPLLNQGSAGLAAMGDEAARLGLVFDDKTLAASKRLSLAQKDLKDNIEAVKTRIGVAFLPVLAEWSGYLLSIATAILPKVFAALETFTGWIHTAIGVVGDMRKAASGGMTGGGDFLGQIIGPAAADEFMKTVTNVSLTLNHFWELVVKPAFKWVKDNVPLAWENVKTAVSNMWTVVEPKLEGFVGKLGELKQKYDELPPAVQDALNKVALTAVVMKQTGIDDWLLGVANAIGGVGGIAGAITKITDKWAVWKQGIGRVGLLADIALVAEAIDQIWQTTDVVVSHWENLRVAVHDGTLKNKGVLEDFLSRLVTWGDMFDALGLHTQNSLAEWQIMFANFSDAVQLIWPSIALVAGTAWRNILIGIQGMVNGGIDAVNELIKALNSLPGGPDLPLISHVTIELPNLTWAENEINRIAQDRTVRFDVYTYAHNMGLPEITGNALGTDRIVRRPELILVGEAGPERLTVTPLAKGTGGNAGEGHGHDIVMDGRIVGQLLGRRSMRNAGLLGTPIAR